MAAPILERSTAKRDEGADEPDTAGDAVETAIDGEDREDPNEADEEDKDEETLLTEWFGGHRPALITCPRRSRERSRGRALMWRLR
jgi:hypothetical protein